MSITQNQSDVVTPRSSSAHSKEESGQKTETHCRWRAQYFSPSMGFALIGARRQTCNKTFAAPYQPPTHTGLQRDRLTDCKITKCLFDEVASPSATATLQASGAKIPNNPTSANRAQN